METEVFENIKLERLIEKEFGDKVNIFTDKFRNVIEGTVKDYNRSFEIGSFLHKKGVKQIVNNLNYPGQKKTEPHRFNIEDKTLDNLKPDILIIGGGVIGCNALYDLSKYNLDILLIEKEEDVSMGQSSRNDGCIHVGFDLKSDSNKLKYLLRAREILPNLLENLGIDYDFNGQTVGFKSNKYKYAYPLLKLKAIKNHVPGGIKFLSKKKLKEIEPNISDEIKCGLHFPKGGIFSPYLFTIALAEVAIKNGAKISFKTIAESMEVKDGKIISVKTNRGTIYPKVVINAAGVFSDEIAKMANDQTFTIHPRQGTDLIFDNNQTKNLSRTAITIYGSSSKNTKHTKGGGVMPTIDGNILVGPDAIEIENKEDYAVPRSSIDNILAKHKQTMKKLDRNGVIAYFSGTRAATYEEDFEIRKGIYTKNIVHAGGIQSPGLTCAPSIAEDLTKFSLEILGNVKLKKTYLTKREKPIEIRKLSYEERDKLIKENPKYGHIICRCEEISEGEILDALSSPLHPTSVDSIKRRVRAGMGRCQGGFCQMHIVKMISDFYNIKIEDVNKKGEGRIIYKDLKEKSDE